MSACASFMWSSSWKHTTSGHSASTWCRMPSHLAPQSTTASWLACDDGEENRSLRGAIEALSWALSWPSQALRLATVS